jgi:hypothetical protein
MHLDHRLPAVALRIGTIAVHEGVLAVGEIRCSTKGQGSDPGEAAQSFSGRDEFHEYLRPGEAQQTYVSHLK